MLACREQPGHSPPQHQLHDPMDLHLLRPAMVNIRIQANTCGGNPQEQCTNVTTSTNRCVVPGQRIDFDNGPDWEVVVVNSARPGKPDTPGTADVIFTSRPSALYLYGSSAVSSAVATAANSTSDSGAGSGSAVGKSGAAVAAMVAVFL